MVSSPPSSHPGAWQLLKPPAWASPRAQRVLSFCGAQESQALQKGLVQGLTPREEVSLAELGSPGQRWDEMGKPDQSHAPGNLWSSVWRWGPTPISRTINSAREYLGARCTDR